MERSCKPMTYTRAIWLLGLDLNFDEKQVKSKFRFLAKKYHPDLYNNVLEEVKLEVQEKFKEIGRAYEFLEKHYQFYSCEEDFSIEEFKEALLDSFFEYVKVNDNDLDTDKSELIDKVGEVCNLFDTYLGYFCGSKEKLEKAYKKYVGNIEEIYKQFMSKFMNKYKIEKQCVPDNIYYDVSVNTFYAQMLHCKKRQEELELALKDREFRKRLVSLTLDYQYYAFYQEYNLERFIEMIRNQAAEYAYNHKYVMKEDYVIKALHKGINNVFALIGEIDWKFKILENMRNSQLSGEIKELRNLVNTCGALEEVLEKLNKLLESVQEKDEVAREPKEPKVIVQMEEPFLEDEVQTRDYDKTRVQMANNVYCLLMGRFNDFLSKNNNIQNIENVNKSFMVAQKVVELIQAFINSELDSDKLLVLSEISFSDIGNDNLILDKIKNPNNDFRRS